MILFLLSGLFINSCKDPVYDFKKGLDTEISFGGDSLMLPIGSTDTIRLADFLSAEDTDFLKTLEDGGYGFTMSDSITVDDLLASLDVDKLKFDDQIFSQTASLIFGDIDIGDFKIPGFTKKDTIDMNIPTVELGNIAPEINLNKSFEVDFSDFALDNNKLNLSDIEVKTVSNNLLANLFSGYTDPLNPQFDFSTSSDPIDIGNLSVSINYSIEVPDGVTNIHQIDLEAGGVLEISLSLDSVNDGLLAGTFTPDIEINPSDLFVFNPLTPLSNGVVTFDNNNALTFPEYSSSKSYTIDSFHNLPAAVNNLIEISNLVNIAGNITADGTVKENQVLKAKKTDLIVTVKIKDVKIKNMDFDIPAFSTTIDGESSFAINNNEIPEEVNKINTVYLGKDPVSTNSKNLIIYIKPENLPEMKEPDYVINNLTINFPTNFTFGNLAGTTYNAGSNIPFDPVNGLKVELDLDEIDLSDVTINSQTLNWSGQITYNGQISFGGRMDSKNINAQVNPVLNLTSETAIKLTSADVITNDIKEDITSSNIQMQFDIDIADQVARLGSINVKPGCYIRVDINKPTLPLPLKSDGISISFSDMFEFQPNSNLVDNKYQINGEIPDYIELELKALHINKELVDGKLTLNDSITIGGGITMEAGTVNSTAIASLNKETLKFTATVSDMFIESTSLDMKSLEALYEDKTSIAMEINDIPSEIISLDSITLKDGAKLKMEVSISNMPDLGSNPLNADMTLKFPEILRFASGEVNENNELVIKQAFVDGKLSKEVKLEGLAFDGSPLEGLLKIDDDVAFDVNVSVKDPTINSEELNGEDISVEVKVTLSGLDFKSVYGKFDVNIDDQLNIPNIALNDIPEMLRGDDVVLDISNPVISLLTESNIGIPVDAELSMTQFKNGEALTDNKLAFNFSLPKSSSPTEFIKAGYWISPSESGKPEGYTYIEKAVQNLFKPVPDSIKLDIVPTINTGYQHFIDLMADYKLKVKYDVIVPFTFGKDLSILVKDTINDVDLGLEDINLSSGSLEITANITNAIPLDLELELVMTDADLNILSTSSGQKISAGAPDGSGVTSKINIKLADSLASLKTLNKVILVFKATSNTTVAGTPIRPKNYIKAELKARIVGGIKVTL